MLQMLKCFDDALDQGVYPNLAQRRKWFTLERCAEKTLAASDLGVVVARVKQISARLKQAS